MAKSSLIDKAKIVVARHRGGASLIAMNKAIGELEAAIADAEHPGNFSNALGFGIEDVDDILVELGGRSMTLPIKDKIAILEYHERKHEHPDVPRATLEMFIEERLNELGIKLTVKS